MISGSRRAVVRLALYGAPAVVALVLAAVKCWEAWPSWQEAARARALVQSLREANPRLSGMASEQLARIGSAALGPLVEATRDRDPRVRRMAYAALKHMVPMPDALASTLASGLRDGDAAVRRGAAAVLARMDPHAKEVAGSLATALGDEDHEVRYQAARALQGIEPGGRPLKVLLALLTDPNLSLEQPNGRTDVAATILRMGPEAEARAIAALTSRIGEGSRSMRREAVECIGLFGSHAVGAVPALEKVLSDEDRLLRCLAALSLSEIEGMYKGRARALLQQLVDDPGLPPELREPTRWTVAVNLVGGSEHSHPVHRLRQVAEAFRLAEARGSESEGGP
jgi:HEAT repeat protein